MSDGTLPHAPSDDATVPAAQQGTLFLSPPFDSEDSVFETQRADGSVAPMTSVHAPKRSGADLDAPSPQGARTTSQDAKDAGENVFRARHGLAVWGLVGNSAVNNGNFYRASRVPVLGWPTKKVIFGTDGPGPHNEHRPFDMANF